MTRLPDEPDRLFLWPEPEQWRGSRVATSHQPELFHAGIWVREFLLAELQRQGWETLYFEADSARCDVQAVVPGREPVRVERISLASGVLDQLPAPSQAGWEDFLDRLGPVQPYRGWLEADNLARFLAGIRHQAGGLDLPRGWQSEWLESPVSARLLAPILEAPDDFRLQFNAVCREERARHGWRSLAHPFPELRQEGERIELPLWVNRQPVWVDRHGTLWAAGKAVEDRSALRPRAVLWSAFCRLSSDLYLHGTGGAAYDQATDLVLRRFYQLEPPPYGVVWLNYWLALPADAQAPVRQAELTARLWQLRHNPQRFLPADHPTALEKQRLLEELQQAPRLRRAGLTRELQALNRSLDHELFGLRESLERQRAEADLSMRELAAARFRGYSWLVVDPSRLRAISTSRLASLAPRASPTRSPPGKL